MSSVAFAVLAGTASVRMAAGRAPATASGPPASRAKSASIASSKALSPVTGNRRLERWHAYNAAAPAMLKNMTSGRYSKRRAAMRFFTGAGRMAVPLLRRELKSARSPQLRATLFDLLQSIHIHYIWGDTPITMHLQNASPSRVLDALSKKTGIKFVILSPRYATAGAKIDINATRQPFWKVMNQLQRQSGLACAQRDYHNAFAHFALQAGPRTIPPEFIYGPFMVRATKISRDASNMISVRLALFSEPKLIMLNCGRLTVDQAVGDTGKALLPPDGFVNTFCDAGRVTLATVQLSPIGGPGKHTAKFRGHWNQLVATRIATWTVKNPMTAKKSTHALADGTTMIFEGMKKVGHTYIGTVKLSCPSNPMMSAMAKETAIIVQGNFLVCNSRLLDAGGRAFHVLHRQTIEAANYTCIIIWTKATRPGGAAPVEPPKKLVIAVPVGLQNVDVPVQFDHLRLP